MFFNKIPVRFFLTLLISIFTLSSYTENRLEEHINNLGDKNAKCLTNMLLCLVFIALIFIIMNYQKLKLILLIMVPNNIYKDFPLDKPAMFASMIAHCFSGDQYHEVLSSLYRNQKMGLVSDNSGKFYSALHSILKIHDITLEKIIVCTMQIKL